MNILVVGASGKTGRWLVQHLVDGGHLVTVMVRPGGKLPEALAHHDRVTMIRGGILDLADADMIRFVQGQEAIASCLGHPITWSGIFGHPRRLVTEATRRLCAAIKANTPEKPARLVLMNTVANRNLDIAERQSCADRAVLGLMRLMLPPQADNEDAANYLRTVVGQQDGLIEWVVVRPDTLTDENKVTAYTAHPSPTRSGVFNPGRSSRINVAFFMAELMTHDNVWRQWKGQMPVIYNAAAPDHPVEL